MKNVLIFGGTSEGRKISRIISENGISCFVSVATEYGEQLLEDSDNLKILKGRLEEKQIEEFCIRENIEFIVDATHPYAAVVSENLKSVCRKINIPLYRYERKTKISGNSHLRYFDSAIDCAEFLKSTEGNILLTTGSKDLSAYCSDEKLLNRIYARVLPAQESLEICLENKLEGKHIIAMQGPFSRQMNQAQLMEISASYMVTKESGTAGGTDEKIKACLNTETECLIIRKVNSEKCLPPEKYYSFDSITDLISAISNEYRIRININRNVHVSLIGIGMGNKNMFTQKALEQISDADIIFGAQRMLESINTKGKMYPYYMAKQIVPVLNKYIEESSDDVNAAVLFSGDTGFCSGAKKLIDELKKLKNVTFEVIPGISSMSYLASKLFINYEDAELCSLHGTEESEWKSKLTEFSNAGKKIFMLTSGIENVVKIGKFFADVNSHRNSDLKYMLGTGYQLSYENESIKVLTPEQAMNLTEKGLYSIFAFLEV